MGREDRKLNRKSKPQSKALWAVYNLYNGELPEQHVIKKIARELAISQRIVYKWFWDKMKYYKERKVRKGKSQNNSPDSEALHVFNEEERSWFAISLVKKCVADEFEASGIAHYTSSKYKTDQGVLDKLVRSNSSERFNDVNDSIQDLADDLGLPITQMAMHIVDQDKLKLEKIRT